MRHAIFTAGTLMEADTTYERPGVTTRSWR